MTRGVAWLFIALRKSLWPRQHRDVRSIGSLPFDLAYPRLDTGTSSGPSPLYRSRHSAMTRPLVERTYSSAFQIPSSCRLLSSAPTECSKNIYGSLPPSSIGRSRRNCSGLLRPNVHHFI